MSIKHVIAIAALAGVTALTWPIAPSADEDEGSKRNRPAYPSSIESMIERRRDAMERRRERRRDAISGRRWHQPPWANFHEDQMDRQEEAMDEMFRRRRDAAEARRDAWGRWNNPWSQWRQDRNEARKNARDLDRLRRDELFDRRFYSGPWGGYRPYW
ncbi:MAG: hypothetical protein ABW086_01425 [Sedimenticola sp.]